jgi:hypothetical protein
VQIPTRFLYQAGVLVYADATERSWLDPPRKAPANLAERLELLEQDLEAVRPATVRSTGTGRTSWDHILERDGQWTVPADESIRAFAGIGRGTK